MMPAAKRDVGNAAEMSGAEPRSADGEMFFRSGSDFVFLFRAMATPCEVRIETSRRDEAEAAAAAAKAEARRIEQKFSRYREDNIVAKINSNGGRAVELDGETAHLVTFARFCHELSDGLFDITSGVLRRIWTFDGSDRLPSDAQIKSMRRLVGWTKTRWQPPFLQLRPGMEIDFGGLGKEYAVDRALAAAHACTQAPLLVNFGGDLRCSGPRSGGESWKVAIESVDKSGEIAAMLELRSGALATSGDARRFLIRNGVRYSHILDPRTCRPVPDAPRSVTVAGQTCLEAGMMATIAMLKGRGAEQFLAKDGVRSWCIR